MKLRITRALVIPLGVVFLFLMTGCPGKSHNSCSYYTNATLIPMNNADSIAVPAGSSGVLAKAFYLELILRDTAYNCSRLNWFATQSVYAERFNSVSWMRVDSISLISDHDFDTAHPAGTNLRKLFTFPDSSFTYGMHPGTNNFYLLSAPADSGTHTFTIHIYQSDSVGTKNIIATSAPVKLLL